MKKIILFLVLCLLASVQKGLSQERDTIVIHDTVYIEKPKKKAFTVESTNLIKMKAIGRYDRGILNYRFVPKGKWIGGLTFSYVNLDSDDSSLLYSIIGDVDASFTTKSIHPFVGYALRDNVVVGAKFGYSHVIGDLGNLDLNLGDDLSFNIGNMRYTEDMYSFGVFNRSYIGLDENGIFGLFNETALTYKRGTSKFSNGEGEDMSQTETNVNEIHLGINPGVAVYITKNVCAEMSFGVAGFKYRWEEQRDESGEIGKRNSSGANFKINLFNINIGITFCM